MQGAALIIAIIRYTSSSFSIQQPLSYIAIARRPLFAVFCSYFYINSQYVRLLKASNSHSPDMSKAAFSSQVLHIFTVSLIMTRLSFVFRSVCQGTVASYFLKQEISWAIFSGISRLAKNNTSERQSI